jgi:hypothetical protein
VAVCGDDDEKKEMPLGWIDGRRPVRKWNRLRIVHFL